MAARMLSLSGRYSGLRQRRVFVKTKLVLLRGKGVSAAYRHIKYIKRDGVGPGGQPGRLYSAPEGPVDGKAFAERCDGDRHQFRVIVAIDDGAQYQDLSPLIRRFMARMEEDLGTSLQWVAADHRDTHHPHTHILLRGKDDTGENLVISPEYIKHGMRHRLSGMVSIDLGPRTDYEVAPTLRVAVDAERLTSIDQDLLARMDDDRVVMPAAPDMSRYALEVGRLRQLERFGLAEQVAYGEWELAENLEPILARMGESEDMYRILQRELKVAGIDRQQLLHRPGTHSPVVGKIVASGVANRVLNIRYLIVDGVDGRSHIVSVGNGEHDDPLPNGAIIRVEPRRPTPREIDRTVAGIAANHGGKYSSALHFQAERNASRDYVEAHARRLEAIRRDFPEFDRAPDGSWTIPTNFRELAARHDSLQPLHRPVEIRLLSPVPFERLATHNGATWLDREIISPEPRRVDHGFGHEVASAIAARRTWLAEEGLGSFEGDQFFYQRNMLEILEDRELQRTAAAIARRNRLSFSKAGPLMPIEGVVRRQVNLASGSFALIENRREFSLVPWEPILARSINEPVLGRMSRGGEISWSIGRSRGLGL